MPRTAVVFYRDDDGSVPVLDWLGGLPLKARLKCLTRIERLRELGYELQRPEADFLRDGVYELRISLNHIQYRILYAFHTGADA
jgi:phage-related protein